MRRPSRVVCLAVFSAACLLVLTGVWRAPVEAFGARDRQPTQGPSRNTTAAPSALAAGPTITPAHAGAVVRIVVYWAEGCGHCHEVLDGVLPQLQAQYGPGLEVRLVEVVSLEDISAFFDLAEAYGYPRGRASVPFLLIGERALMGVEQIRQELPALIEAAFAAGGTDWPSAPRAGTAGAAALSDDACGFSVPCPENAVDADPVHASKGRAVILSPSLMASALILGLGAITSGLLGLRKHRARAGQIAQERRTH